MVATCLTDPIAWFELYGGAVSIVALAAEGVVVVAASGAKPVAGLPRLKERSASAALLVATVHRRPQIQRLALRALPSLRQERDMLHHPRYIPSTPGPSQC